MYSAWLLRGNSRILPNSIKNYGFKYPLAFRPVGISNLSARRLLAVKPPALNSSNVQVISRPICQARLCTTLACHKRLFHTTRPKEVFSSFRGGRPPFKVYRISPVMLFFTAVGFFALAFAIIPLVFTFFLPLFIGTVVVFQFGKWRRNILLREVFAGLKRSSMRVHYNSVRALYVKNLENVLNLEQQNAESLKDVLKRFNEALGSQINGASSAEADRLLSFIDARLLEAIENDEAGVRSYFLGNDVDSWVTQNYELELDASKIKANGRVFGNNLIVALTFPLYLKSSGQPPKHLAEVSLVISRNAHNGTPNPPFPFQPLSMADEECQMVLSIRPTGFASTRQFVITTPGSSGDLYSKYDVKQTPDNHTEYTIRHNGK